MEISFFNFILFFHSFQTPTNVRQGLTTAIKMLTVTMLMVLSIVHAKMVLGEME